MRSFIYSIVYFKVSVSIKWMLDRCWLLSLLLLLQLLLVLLLGYCCLLLLVLLFIIDLIVVLFRRTQLNSCLYLFLSLVVVVILFVIVLNYLRWWHFAFCAVVVVWQQFLCWLIWSWLHTNDWHLTHSANFLLYPLHLLNFLFLLHVFLHLFFWLWFLPFFYSLFLYFLFLFVICLLRSCIFNLCLFIIHNFFPLNCCLLLWLFIFLLIVIHDIVLLFNLHFIWLTLSFGHWFQLFLSLVLLFLLLNHLCNLYRFSIQLLVVFFLQFCYQPFFTFFHRPFLHIKPIGLLLHRIRLWPLLLLVF